MFSGNANISSYGPDGHTVSGAEQVWEYHAARLNDAVANAYKEFPLSSNLRRVMIGRAIDRADQALKVFTRLTVEEVRQLQMNYSALMGADAEGRQEVVADFMGRWMHIYYGAVERAQVGAA